MDDSVLFSLFKKYKLNNNEIGEILNIIYSIYNHDEFQRRMTDEFMHHDNISLGEHILEVAIFSYIMYKKYKRNENLDLGVLLKTAMFHDLYTEPWQNNPYSKVIKSIHKHAYRHPVEAVINSAFWFPDEFLDFEKSKKIVDGVVHHMAPLPVPKFTFDDMNLLELKNFDKIGDVSDDVKNILRSSCDRLSFKNVSIAFSNYYEGKIVSIADKVVAIDNMKHSNINGFLAIFTGENNNFEKVRMIKK